MNAIELISQDLFDKVRSRFSNLQMGDENGGVTLDPKAARFFDFDFVIEGNDLGRVSVSINDLGTLKIFYSQGITEGQDSVTQGFWFDFLREMRGFAKRRMLRFDTRDITKGNLEKQDFQYLAINGSKEPNMNESQMYGSSKSSYRPLDKTLLIIRHNQKVGEDRGARSRSNNINAIFIQNEAGERFKYPMVHLAGARAMQRHVANGGAPYDTAGSAIIKMSETIAQLNTFKRAVGNTEQLTSEAVGIVDRVGGKLKELRNTMENISKQTHYEQWREGVEAEEEKHLSEIDQTTIEDYKSKFTVSSFKEDLAQFFPLVYSIMQEAGTVDLDDYIGETKDDVCDDCGKDPCECGDEEKVDEMTEFENWADEIAMERFIDPHTNPASSAKHAGSRIEDEAIENGKVTHNVIDQALQTAQQMVDSGTSPEEALSILGSELEAHGHNPNSIDKILQVVNANLDRGEVDEGVNKSDVPAYLRKQKGEKPLTKQELDAEPEKNISHPKTLARNSGRDVKESGYYLGAEDLPDWTRDALHRVSRGEVKDWTELYGELSNFIDDDAKAERIAKMVFAKGGGVDSMAQHRVAPPDDGMSDMPGADDDSDDDSDDAFLDKLRAKVKANGSVGTNPLEPTNELPGMKEDGTQEYSAREVAETILSHYDRETGKFPLGETGVITKIKKEFGDNAGNLAEKLIQRLQAQSEAVAQMEAMRRLSGLPPLTEAQKREMTRAAKGVMKYGKDGMKALAKAGKDGKDLDKVRDKYNKYDESTGDYSAKKGAAGKDLGKPGKNFAKIAKKSGGGEKGKKIAGAVLAKLRAK